MPIQYQCGSSMAIRQICHYKYTNRIYIIQILVRQSVRVWHKKRLSFGSRFLRPKGLAKQSFATPFIFTIPPNLPFRREAYGKCSTCSPSVNTYYQHSALALLTTVRVPGSAPGWLVVYLQTLQNVDLSSYKNFLIALYFFAIKNRVRVYQHKIFLLTFAVELEWWCQGIPHGYPG